MYDASDFDKFLREHTGSKRSNNTVPRLYTKALIDMEALRTFTVEWLSGDNYLPYQIDIIANDVYIYNKDKHLKFIPKLHKKGGLALIFFIIIFPIC